MSALLCLSAAELLAQSSIERHFQAAKQAEQGHDYPRAAREYLKILELDPRSAETYQNLGLVYHLQNKYAQAIGAFEKALELKTDLWGSSLFLGIGYYRTNQFARAVPALEKALALNPAQAQSEALFWLGAAHVALEQYEPAIEYFERLLLLKPADIEVLYNLAQAHRKYAAYLFDSILKAEPSSPRVFQLQAESHQSAGRLEEALREFERALGLQPHLRGAHQAMGEIYLQMGQKEKSAGEFALEARIKADAEPAAQADTWYALGKMHVKRAHDLLRKMVDLAPDSYRVQQLIGEDYEKREQYAEALEAYQAAFARKADLPGIRFSIGSVYWKTRRFDQAIRWLEDELKVNPHHALTHYQLGNIYAHRGQPDRALVHLEQAVSARPGFSEGRRELGRVLGQQKRYEEAAQQLRIVAEQQPDDPAIHASLSGIYRKQGKEREARAELEAFKRLSEKSLNQAREKLSKDP